MSSVRRPPKDPCWLLWDFYNGTMYLRSICTDKVLVAAYKKVILKEAESFDLPRPRLYVEESQLNHLYGRIER
jgi:hypothetical protein